MAEPFIGEIMMFCGNFAPAGWQLCNGQLLQISQYSALYSVIGNSFGGDGRTTFALPDLRGRVPVHQGQGASLSPYTIGNHGGGESVTLSSNQMPVHTHLMSADGNGGGKTSPVGNIPAAVSSTSSIKPYSAGPAGGNMAASAIAPAGGNTPVSVLQPYLCVNFVIATQGIYPTRE